MVSCLDQPGVEVRFLDEAWAAALELVNFGAGFGRARVVRHPAEFRVRVRRGGPPPSLRGGGQRGIGRERARRVRPSIVRRRLTDSEEEGK